MSQYLYCIRPTRLQMLTAGPDPNETEIIGRHFSYLEDLVSQGIVLMAGRTLNNDDRTFGIVVLVAPSEGEAVQIMNADPAVQTGVMRAELFAYRIALWSPTGPAAALEGAS